MHYFKPFSYWAYIMSPFDLNWVMLAISSSFRLDLIALI